MQFSTEVNVEISKEDIENEINNAKEKEKGKNQRDEIKTKLRSKADELWNKYSSSNKILTEHVIVIHFKNDIEEALKKYYDNGDEL